MATVDDIQPGQTCYLADGREASFVGRLGDDAFIVHTILRSYDPMGEDVYAEGPLTIERSIYRKPPQEKLEAEVAALRDEVAKLQADRDTLRREVIGVHSEKAKAEKDAASAFEAARLVPALRGIIAMMDGHLKFAVVESSRAPFFTVVEGAATRKAQYKDEPIADLRLDWSGKPVLRLRDWRPDAAYPNSQRHDMQAVDVFQTREEAHAEAVRRLLEIKERSPEWIESAEKLGVPVSLEDRQTAHGWYVRGAQAALESAQKNLREQEAKLAATIAAMPSALIQAAKES